MIEACSTCRGPLPMAHAANLFPDGTRTCLGTCKPLYLFESGNPDWVVAHDESDALQVWCDHIGETPDGYDPGDWERMADDATMKMWLDPDGRVSCPDEGDGAELKELAALEVVQRFGRRFIASVDF